MAKKTFKEKEQEFLAKNKIETTNIYTPQKRAQDIALEMLEKEGFKVSVKDSILYCMCKDNEEFNQYKSFLLKHFGKDGKVSFSYGAGIEEYKDTLEER